MAFGTDHGYPVALRQSQSAQGAGETPTPIPGLRVREPLVPADGGGMVTSHQRCRRIGVIRVAILFLAYTKGAVPATGSRVHRSVTQ
jgi:hypothetical protein